MEIHVSSKNIILVLQSRSDRAENNCKRPELSNARDNNDQPGVPDGAARLKTRSAGWNRAGWELNTDWNVSKLLVC